jgi:hypothetical protein
MNEKHLFYMEPFFRVRNLELAKKLEIYWIAEDRKAHGYDSIMNNTDGGEGTVGRVITEETRSRMSEVQRGKTSPRKGAILSPETRKKISDSNRGRLGTRRGVVVSQDTKDKQSKAKRGRPLKFETKQKLRKLNEEQIREVFELLKSGMYQHDIAKKFNISKQNVSLINLGKTYQEFQYLKESNRGVVQPLLK